MKKRLEGMHAILFGGHRLCRYRAKVKVGEKPVLVMAMLDTQLFDCCLKA